MQAMCSYEDFEGYLIAVAEAEGWQFLDGDEVVGSELVFNRLTYGPAILKTAEEDLHHRGVDVDLGLAFSANEEALMGMEVAFREEAQQPARPLYAETMWRLCLAMNVVRHLPRRGNYFDLTVLALTFGPASKAEPA